ncbi:uncharacterized protein YALI1_D28993g [Yarrowia lipolytica]|uniref:Uncharacterized protein n=1 Tax=Yarrowia lipolytica TaxID=4952 RepID=A0A1D8NFS5_YARLL|nr:hypothetical protein YALI1_D28993g [Yarrowia lipolytica]
MHLADILRNASPNLGVSTPTNSPLSRTTCQSHYTHQQSIRGTSIAVRCNYFAVALVTCERQPTAEEMEVEVPVQNRFSFQMTDSRWPIRDEHSQSMSQMLTGSDIVEEGKRQENVDS